mmetsp:Transcript_777/g.1157  ORF Transcript_777/g.1157 Transcript_777/m.1157 type:complete len:98 (-) Transcript_777:551-844(-)
MIAVTMEPTLAPDMTRGNMPAVNKALTTPTWYKPKVAPPDRHKQLRPNVCLKWEKNSNLSAAVISGDSSRQTALNASAVRLKLRSRIFLVPPVCRTW